MISRFIMLLERCCLFLSGAALFAIMALTFLDVLGRKFLAHSIPGSLELTELLMVIVIFGALPSVSRRDEHVKFDSLDSVLSPTVRAIQWVIVSLLAAAIFLALAWLMWTMAGDFSANGETTATFKIPKAPFIYVMGILCAAAALMHIATLRKPASGTPNRIEETPL